MADQGESTLVTESDEVIDVICDPCHTEKKRVEAKGHCIDCNENLCVGCITVHRNIPVLKGHAINSTSTLSYLQKEKDPMTDRCSKHPAELIKFYCNPHNTLGCSVCVSLDHRSCKNMSYIRDVSGGITYSDELKQVQYYLQILLARLTSTQHRTKWSKQVVDDSYTQTVSDIRNLKKTINDTLDNLEKELLDKAFELRDEKLAALNSAISTCDVSIEETRKFITDLQKKKSMNHNNRLFISMKTAQDRLHALGDTAENSTKHCGRLSFQQSENIAKLSSALTNLGTITSQSERRTVKYKHELYVKYDTEKENCLITGMSVLPDGRLALTDNNNKSVKLIDVIQRKVSDQIRLDVSPLDITHVKGKNIAVTVYGQRYIQVLSVSPSLSKCHKIAVPGLYGGIEYSSSSDTFIAVCRDPINGVHICDKSGVLLHEYCQNNNTLPFRIAISPDHGVLYLTDHTENTVVYLTRDGKLIRLYVNGGLQGPAGVTVDDDGFVYVCSNDDSTVHRLSPGGQLVKILLDEKAGIKFPEAIAYSAGTLYISSNSTSPARKNNLQVFTLERYIYEAEAMRKQSRSWQGKKK